MLRIKSDQPPAPPVAPPDIPVGAAAIPDAPADKPAKFSVDKVDPSVARYMTADQGPFQCDHCEHFTDNGDCDIVSGPIDPAGVCILFTSAAGDQKEGDLVDATNGPDATGAPGGGNPIAAALAAASGAGAAPKLPIA